MKVGGKASKSRKPRLFTLFTAALKLRFSQNSGGSWPPRSHCGASPKVNRDYGNNSRATAKRRESLKNKSHVKIQRYKKLGRHCVRAIGFLEGDLITGNMVASFSFLAIIFAGLVVGQSSEKRGIQLRLTQKGLDYGELETIF